MASKYAASVLAILLLVGQASAFYLPGVAPQDFDKVWVLLSLPCLVDNVLVMVQVHAEKPFLCLTNDKFAYIMHNEILARLIQIFDSFHPAG
jgi:hypothetical protein